MAGRSEKLLALLTPSVEGLGYELVDVEFHPAPKNAVLRVYIDGPDGIGLTDCERVSRQIGAVLDVADPIGSNYSLEVSSPGLDRVLRTVAHFESFIGSDVKVLLKLGRDGRRKYRGRLVAVDDDRVELNVDGQSEKFELREIEKARLVPNG